MFAAENREKKTPHLYLPAFFHMGKYWSDRLYGLNGCHPPDSQNRVFPFLITDLL